MSSGPKTATPPPNAARGATADLCDIYITDPVDVVSQRNVQIMEPVFRSLITKPASPDSIESFHKKINPADLRLNQYSAEHDRAFGINPN